MPPEVLAVIGTLGAAFLGFIGIIYTNYQNNHHTDELEKQKYTQEEQTRNRDKNIALLEEFSSLYFKLNKGRFSQLSKASENGSPFPLAESVNRMSVIAILYFDDLKQAYFRYVEAHGNLQKLYGEMDDFVKAIDGSDIPPGMIEYASEIEKRLKDAREEFDMASGLLLVEIKEQSDKLKSI